MSEAETLHRLREAVKRRNHEIAGRDGKAGRFVSLGMIRTQLGFIATRWKPWRGAADALAICEGLSLCIVEGEAADLTEEGRAVLAALDALAKEGGA